MIARTAFLLLALTVVLPTAAESGWATDPSAGNGLAPPQEGEKNTAPQEEKAAAEAGAKEQPAAPAVPGSVQRRRDDGLIWEQGEWLRPENLEKRRAGLFRLGRRWVNQTDADKFHADRDTPWEVKGTGFTISSNAPLDHVRSQLNVLSHAHNRMREYCLGREPGRDVEVRVYRTDGEYNALQPETIGETMDYTYHSHSIGGVYNPFFDAMVTYREDNWYCIFSCHGYGETFLVKLLNEKARKNLWFLLGPGHLLGLCGARFAAFTPDQLRWLDGRLKAFTVQEELYKRQQDDATAAPTEKPAGPEKKPDEKVAAPPPEPPTADPPPPPAKPVKPLRGREHLIPIEVLVTTEMLSPSVASNNRFFDQSAALISLLMHDARFADRFKDLRDAVLSGKETPTAALRKRFELKELEDALADRLASAVKNDGPAGGATR